MVCSSFICAVHSADCATAGNTSTSTMLAMLGLHQPVSWSIMAIRIGSWSSLITHWPWQLCHSSSSNFYFFLFFFLFIHFNQEKFISFQNLSVIVIFKCFLNLQLCDSRCETEIRTVDEITKRSTVSNGSLLQWLFTPVLWLELVCLSVFSSGLMMKMSLLQWLFQQFYDEDESVYSGFYTRLMLRMSLLQWLFYQSCDENWPISVSFSAVLWWEWLCYGGFHASFVTGMSVTMSFLAVLWWEQICYNGFFTNFMTEMSIYSSFFFPAVLFWE